ncbi:hypothetical protein BpHYR1_018398 [Brachionus plicatilis]|uniref:Uncharacterized protein n=1 Tax=Brachionus plicatilis TaxID=10195 RepID=A0A3M7P6J7_BRAPC|nr:hypothetical protein BpHYR1_018398 [Brachionus plicatilis]
MNLKEHQFKFFCLQLTPSYQYLNLHLISNKFCFTNKSQFNTISRLRKSITNIAIRSMNSSTIAGFKNYFRIFVHFVFEIHKTTIAELR